MNTILTDKQRPRPLVIALAIVLLCGAGFGAYKYFFDSGPKGPPPVRPLTVKAGEAKPDTVSVYIHALGNVTPPRTVTVRSRVDGELIALHFAEGRRVKEGELLAEIDPRPFEVQKAQALGSLARDEALLKDAKLDLERYKKLIRERSISQQQLQAQEALVGQYEGAVLADKAAVAEAELQLTYSRVVAPVSGRAGLRRVDIGNIVRSSDTDGLVVITQIQPMDVVFTLVEKQIPEVIAGMRKGRLEVEAWGQDNKKLLAKGVLKSLDNQIDTATGTVKAKAEFANTDEMLFPNQFVNVRLRVREMPDVLTIPTSAVQRNINGFFVYVVEDGKTRMREITSGYATDLTTVVDSGLRAGDLVVTDGVDRLREGTAVTIWRPSGNGSAAEASASAEGADMAGEGEGSKLEKPDAVGRPSAKGAAAGDSGAAAEPGSSADGSPDRGASAPASPTGDGSAPALEVKSGARQNSTQGGSPVRDGYQRKSVPGVPGLDAPKQGEQNPAGTRNSRVQSESGGAPALRCAGPGPVLLHTRASNPGELAERSTSF